LIIKEPHAETRSPNVNSQDVVHGVFSSPWERSPHLASRSPEMRLAIRPVPFQPNPLRELAAGFQTVSSYQGSPEVAPVGTALGVFKVAMRDLDLEAIARQGRAHFLC